MPGWISLKSGFAALLPFYRESFHPTFSIRTLPVSMVHSLSALVRRAYMPTRRQVYAALLASAFCVGTCFAGAAQTAGNSGSLSGTVVDPTGAVVPNATVQIR